ncbi:MAG TPA: hypothetical protein VMC80_01740 [Patescibacteria group bacterium]|nr:hypothetical protein [Patescibacteria group bacterium]
MARKRQRHNHEHLRGFPVFALIILVTGIVWLLNDLKILSVDIPWIPSLLIVIAIGMLVRFRLMNKWFNGR